MLCYCFCINYTIHVSEPLIINIIFINMILIIIILLYHYMSIIVILSVIISDIIAI